MCSKGLNRSIHWRRLRLKLYFFTIVTFFQKLQHRVRLFAGLLAEIVGLLSWLRVVRPQRRGHRLHRAGHHRRRRHPGCSPRLLPLTLSS